MTKENKLTCPRCKTDGHRALYGVNGSETYYVCPQCTQELGLETPAETLDKLNEQRGNA